MHKLVLKTFGFLKSTTDFIKIFIVFCILMLLLYWIETLAGYKWAWLDFIKPVLDAFIFLGSKISTKSFNLFNAVFEYKYGIALLLMVILFYLDHGIFLLLKKLELLYNDGRRFVHKIQENQFNRTLEINQKAEQKNIQKYQLYVRVLAKKGHVGVNLDEQIQLMKKFLVQKCGVLPTNYEEGLLFKFDKFDDVDTVLEHFFKLINSEAPLNFFICLNLGELDENTEKLFKKLISMNFENKIAALANVAYRYRFNKDTKYELSQLGLFQTDNSTIEVHQFIDCN